MSGNQVEQYQALGREALTEGFERQANAAVDQAVAIRNALGELAPHLLPDAAEAE